MAMLNDEAEISWKKIIPIEKSKTITYATNKLSFARGLRKRNLPMCFSSIEVT